MKLNIGFTGDIAFSEYTKEIYRTPEKIDSKIYDFFKNNDYNVLNFESPITESILSEKAALTHKSSPDALTFIKEKVRNPVLSLANNHMMDFGPKGLLDTLKYVKKEKLPFIGAGKNSEEATDYIILGENLKVGLIAAQYKDYYVATENRPGPAQNKHFRIIKQKIKELKSKTDWVVMVYHGGEEFINTPMPYTRKLYKKFLSWGVDVVVAHHPHTVQGYEKIGNKTIFYSLGNFVFDTDFQRAQYGTDEGMLINLEFSKDKYEFKSYPLKRDREEGTINIVEKNSHFKDVNRNYKVLWKNDARKLMEINKKKKELKKYRNKFSINNLYIGRTEIENLVSFDELVKNNYIKELDKTPNIKTKNIVLRKLARVFETLKTANYKKYIYMKYAQIFK